MIFDILLSVNFWKIVILIISANFGPLIAKDLFKKRFTTPLDFGAKFYDGNPVLGNHKTWRGVFAAVLLASFVAVILNMSFMYGLAIAIGVMAGDILTSFIKRRFGCKAGAEIPLLDQIPEALGGLLVLNLLVPVELLTFVLAPIIFIVAYVFGSRAYVGLVKHINFTPLINSIAKTGIKPNHITVLSLVFGLIAIIFLALKNFYLGVVFILAERGLDALDGALARYTKKETVFGVLFDSITDVGLACGYFFGAAVGGFLTLTQAIIFSIVWIIASIILWLSEKPLKDKIKRKIKL